MPIQIADRFNAVTENTAQKITESESFSPTNIYIGDIRVDLIINERPRKAWDIARYQVDGDSDLADHRLKQPNYLEMVILLTDDQTPVEGDDQLDLASTQEGKTWQDKKAQLEDFAETTQLVQVVTPFAIYDSMVVTRLEPERLEERYTDGIFYRVTMEEMKITGVDVVPVSRNAIPRNSRGKAKSRDVKKRQLGTKEPTQAEKDEAFKQSFEFWGLADWVI